MSSDPEDEKNTVKTTIKDIHNSLKVEPYETKKENKKEEKSFFEDFILNCLGRNFLLPSEPPMNSPYTPFCAIEDFFGIFRFVMFEIFVFLLNIVGKSGGEYRGKSADLSRASSVLDYVVPSSFQYIRNL